MRDHSACGKEIRLYKIWLFHFIKQFESWSDLGAFIIESVTFNIGLFCSSETCYDTDAL